MSRLSQTIKQVKANNKRSAVARGSTYTAFRYLLGSDVMDTCRCIGMRGPENAELRYSTISLILGGVICLGSTH